MMTRNGVHSHLVNYEPKGRNSRSPPSRGFVSALVNVPSNTRAGHLRRFVGGPISQGGAAVVSRPEPISVCCTEKSLDPEEVQRNHVAPNGMSPRVSYNIVS